ncbi:hypothetical protein RFI_30779, partial [Reticulomyxa filosa]
IFELTKDIQQFKMEISQTIIDLKKQIDNLKHELQEKINALKINNIEFKKQFEQYQIQFNEYKQNIETKVENKDTNIQQHQLQIKTQFEEEQKNEQKEKKQYQSCNNMLSFIQISNLKNGIDFLLINENKEIIKLKNNEWNNYNFGIFLLGEDITLTPNCKELGYLKIKTSHLWIKHPSSKIDCSQLGYPRNQGPGRGMYRRREDSGDGGGYGTNGGYRRQGGKIYGEETLLKEIHFGSGGGYIYGGSGGGIIELIIEQQLINHGSIQSNGGNGHHSGGSGSGGSILIEFQSQSQSQSHLNKLEQTFGTITCIGGKKGQNNGGDGRIAIYGIELSSDDILDIDPKPFNRLHK